MFLHMQNQSCDTILSAIASGWSCMSAHPEATPADGGAAADIAFVCYGGAELNIAYAMGT